MKKITEKADFITFQMLIRQKNNSMYSIEPIKVPGYLQEIINVDGTLLPKHLHVDLLMELLTDELVKLQPNYKVDDYSGAIIDQIVNYASMDEDLLNEKSFSVNKGLLIMGKVGCGKTLIISALANMMKQFRFLDRSVSRSEFNVAYIPVYLITENFIKIGYEIFNGSQNLYTSLPEIAQKIYSEKLFIDDIGSENIVSSFGNTTNVIGELILRRYDTGKLIFATTNLDSKSLKAFYGERVYSRMTEMLNFIVMEGEDRRR